MTPSCRNSIMTTDPRRCFDKNFACFRISVTSASLINLTTASCSWWTTQLTRIAEPSKSSILFPNVSSAEWIVSVSTWSSSSESSTATISSYSPSCRSSSIPCSSKWASVILESFLVISALAFATSKSTVLVMFAARSTETPSSWTNWILKSDMPSRNHCSMLIAKCRSKVSRQNKQTTRILPLTSLKIWAFIPETKNYLEKIKEVF